MPARRHPAGRKKFARIGIVIYLVRRHFWRGPHETATMKREAHHSAGVVLYRSDEPRKYLLLRSALTRRPVWEFPKGALEAGETEQEAARRELHEETGLAEGDYTVRDGFVDEERYMFSRGSGSERRLIRKRVTYFLAEYRRGEVRISREATRFIWATVAEARKLLRFPEKRRVLTAAENWLALPRDHDHEPTQMVQ
jgi:8-oxo-dGTP pyrophosphatase MutT (NUDIX family)